MATGLLLILQAIQVAILWLHDWVPLGRLNDVSAVRREDGPAKLVRVTIVQSAPYTLGLLFCLWTRGGGLPPWLRIWLWVSYGLLFAGELRAWWVPYLLRAEPERAARYARMFGATHSFLPERQGLAPNTLHCILHACTAATLVVMAFG